MKKIENLITEMCNNMRVHGSIVVIGAGASYSIGMPLYGQLAPIVWNVVESNLDIKKKLSIPMGSSAKEYISDDSDLTLKAYEVISDNNNAYDDFRRLFTDLNNEKSKLNSVVHETLCKLLHIGHINLVVSLNWDDLLESAWTRLYGTEINDCKVQLIKPHGCVRSIKNQWILPNSPGFLSNRDITLIKDTLNRPKTLILVGYSESDERIVKELIKPTDQLNKSYRIAPNATSSIPMNATSAFEFILSNYFNSLNKENYFNNVNYTNQIGIESAILGHRLQPSNIKACPELPILLDAKTKLDYAHYVIIESEAGCGKSISAYQLAYKYIELGFEVAKINNDQINDDIKNVFFNNSYRTVFIIDDAQQIDPRIISKLLGYANEKCKIIITQTSTHEYGEEKIRITKKSAVSAIHNYYRNNTSKIMDIVKEINKKSGRSIGNLYMDMTIESVLEMAQNENTPWLYNYSLRGGWSNTRNQYNISSDYNDSHLVLVLVSIKQILSLDKPVDYEWLLFRSEKLQKDKIWLNENLDYLASERIILPLAEMRTHHLQMAIRIIMIFLRDSNKNELKTILAILENEMLSEETPLRGVLWFFNMTFGFESRHILDWNLKKTEFYTKLLARAMSHKDDNEWLYSLHLISDVITRYVKANIFEINQEYDFFLKYSLENVNDETVYPLSLILNDMINCDKSKKAEFVNTLDIELLTKNFSNVDQDHLYSWAKFLDRLAYQQKVGWLKQWNNHFPYIDLKRIFVSYGPEKISSSMTFVYALLSTNVDLAFEVYESLLPNLKIALKNDLSETLNVLELEFLIFICGQRLFSKSHPNKKQKLATSKFVELICENEISDLLQNGVQRDWERLYLFANTLYDYDQEKLEKAILSVDMSKLETNIKSCWINQHSEFEMLIRMLAIFRLEEVDELIFNNSDLLEFIEPTLIVFSPRTVEKLISMNKQINILSSKQIHWDSSKNALKSLRYFNKSLARSIVFDSIDKITETFINLQPIDWEDYHLFFDEVRKCNKEVAKKIIINSYENSVVDNWYSVFNADNHKHNQMKKDVKGFFKLISIIEKFELDDELISNFKGMKDVEFVNATNTVV